MTTTLRLLLAAWILFTLARATRAGWRQRRLVVAVWRAIRPRHVVGSLALLAVVGTLATVLIDRVPGMSVGLGHLLGVTGNAVFVPLSEAVAHAGPAPARGPDWVLIGLSTGFLGLLTALLPWLAFVEEEVFRAGLEDASPPREAAAALVFGLAHLVMLVPVGAALAIAVAGLVYGRLYRRAHRRADGRSLPVPVALAFRPTRRSAAAADRARTSDGDPRPERRQAAAVFASTVSHTTFNTTVVVVVWLGIVISALAP